MQVVDFTTEVAEPTAETAKLLEESHATVLAQYAPSIVGKFGASVTIKVAQNDPLWTPQLERSIRDQIASFQDATGAPCRLTVTRVP